MTGMVQEVVSKRRYLVRFQDGLEKEMLLKQLTIVFVRIEVQKAMKVMEEEMIPEVRYELCCYHWVYIYLHFIKEDGVEKKGG